MTNHYLSTLSDKTEGGLTLAGYNSYDPFSVCFNILKLKYKDYDESLTTKNYLVPNDKVNVFINFETVLKHLSMITDLEKKLIIEREFETILISNILNLIGHYKRFFVNNGLDTRVYLYHTDLSSYEFNQYKYNDEYRTYYLVKYNDNPKFIYLTEALKNKILPDVKTYCEFIPNVYYISAKNIEGSLVPYIIGKEDKNRKNLIISGEFFDTQYSLLPNYVNHYIHRGPGYNEVVSSVPEYLRLITKKDKEVLKPFIDIYSNHSMYCALQSVMGDRNRSIDGINGIGFANLYRQIKEGISSNKIQPTTTSPVLLSEIFTDDDMKEDFINNYSCINIPLMYEELTNAEKSSIYNQRKERNDINTLYSLNNTVFCNHRLILESLLL